MNFGDLSAAGRQNWSPVEKENPAELVLAGWLAVLFRRCDESRKTTSAVSASCTRAYSVFCTDRNGTTVNKTNTRERLGRAEEQNQNRQKKRFRLDSARHVCCLQVTIGESRSRVSTNGMQASVGPFFVSSARVVSSLPWCVAYVAYGYKRTRWWAAFVLWGGHVAVRVYSSKRERYKRTAEENTKILVNPVGESLGSKVVSVPWFSIISWVVSINRCAEDIALESIWLSRI